MIYGVDINSFKNMFGSLSAIEAKRVYEKFRDFVMKGSFLVSITEDERLITEALVEGGQKAQDLERFYPGLMIGVLYTQDNLIGIDTNMWNSYLGPYFQKIAFTVDIKIADLFDHLTLGRGVFNDFPNSDSNYSYLTRDEIEIILNDMQNNWQNYADTTGLSENFKTWLEQLHSGEKDLFMV